MNLLILTYWSFKDALIQAYTLPYVRIIKSHLPGNALIFFVTLEQNSNKINNEDKRVLKSRLKEEGIIWMPFTYSPFGVVMMLKWLLIALRLYALLFLKNIATIHAWCTPAGAIGYFLSKFSGKPLVLDSFEPHAEPMIEAGQWAKDSMAFKLLFELEKRQAKHAKTVIACVPSMKDYALRKYGVDIKNFYHKPACVDFSLFDMRKGKNRALLEELNFCNKLVCVYAGKFGGSYLTQEVFDFFEVCHGFWGDKFRVLLLSNHPQADIKLWSKNANLPPDLITQRFVVHHEMPDYIGLGDFAIVPFVPVPSKRYGSPIKTGEYMAMGLPIVITKEISDDSEMIDKNNLGFVLSTLSDLEYSRSVQWLANSIKEEEGSFLNKKIRKYAQNRKNFKLAEETYKKVYLRII